MKKYLLLAIIAAATWNYFQDRRPHEMPIVLKKDPEPTVAVPAFHCDGREYCSQMTSRAEAEFFIKNCPNTKMDGDHDGEPCENDSRF